MVGYLVTTKINDSRAGTWTNIFRKSQIHGVFRGGGGIRFLGFDSHPTVNKMNITYSSFTNY